MRSEGDVFLFQTSLSLMRVGLFTSKERSAVYTEVIMFKIQIISVDFTP
jgi:hypothetical protein